MKHIHYFLIMVCLLLQGCSSISFRLPWEKEPESNQSLIELQDQLNTQSGKRDASLLRTDNSDLINQPPRLVEPETSSLRPVSQTELLQCQSALAMQSEKKTPADPTNFGKRLKKDAWGRSIAFSPLLIVLHETVLGTPETIAFFQTPHPRDEDQASYHMMIDRNGDRYRFVPDNYRAFGAGMSAFGDMTQRVRPGAVGSINNVALHVSLTSPSDGREDSDSHSGYTDEQYSSLASQVLLWQASYGIPLTRVTTHSAVDRSRSRYDPRSFRWDRFDAHYRKAISLCGFKRFDTKQAGL